VLPHATALTRAADDGVGIMDKYEAVRDIGSGNFGVARLMRNRETRELVAVKLIERGHRVRTLASLLFRLEGFGSGWFVEGLDRRF
jgi:hypothetical protein